MNIKIAMVLTVVGIMILCLVVIKPSANHAFALPAAACSLTLSADPGSGSLAIGESIGQKLSGNLSCGGTGLGATIGLTGLGSSSAKVYTDSSGNYHYNDLLVHSGKSYTINARYVGDYDHQAASATTSINIKEKNSGRFTQP